MSEYEAEPGTYLTHVGACLKAVQDIGGDPATVQELVAALRCINEACKSDFDWIGSTLHQIIKARAVLAKIPEAP